MIDIQDLNEEAEVKDETVTAEAPADETPEVATEAATEEPQQAEPEKKGKKKKKEKEKKVDKRDEQIAELTEHLKRNLAEFDNFRKRTEKEKAAMFEMGEKSLIEKLLPVVDNFERGLATISEEEKADNAFANGMDMVYKQILKIFEDLDVKPIEAVGAEFDPNLHNAVMSTVDENLGENIVAQELQKGYTFRGTVVRHSMVQVANCS